MRLSMPFLISTRIPGAVLTVEFLIYALGGGHGHARRGLLLQQQLFMRGIASVVLLCPGSDCHFPIDCGPRQYGLSLDDPELASLWRKTPERLVVDTFPHGWRGEIEPRFLARFEKTYWIARYTRTIEDPGSGFTRVLSPYPKGQDEWGNRLTHAIHTGYIIDASHWRLSGEGNCFAVFDPEGRCNRQPQPHMAFTPPVKPFLRQLLQQPAAPTILTSMVRGWLLPSRSTATWAPTVVAGHWSSG